MLPALEVTAAAQTAVPFNTGAGNSTLTPETAKTQVPWVWCTARRSCLA